MNKKVRQSQAPKDLGNHYAHQINEGENFINPQSLNGFKKDFHYGDSQNTAAQ